MGTKVDHLTEDDPIPNQNWVCISFLSPEGIKNCSLRAVKIRGVYATEEQARKRAEELSKIDPLFHVFVGEVGKWLGHDPDPNSVQDAVYQEKELQEISEGYKKNLAKSKQVQRQRKDDMIMNAAKAEQEQLRSKRDVRGDKKREQLRKKLEKRKGEKMMKTNEEVNVEESMEKLKEYDEQVKVEREKISDKQKEAIGVEHNIATIDDQIAKIQQLYDKINVKQENTDITNNDNVNMEI